MRCRVLERQANPWPSLHHALFHCIHLPHVYGHPDAALTEAENEEKFFRCCRHAEPPVPEARARRLRDMVAGVEGLADVSALVATLAARD